MSKTILVVDDEKDIRYSLTGILEDEGYHVVTAESGTEALEMVRHELPDLVLLDIWMPGIDGIETLEKLKTLFPQMTIIMISGHGTVETAVRATKLGAFDFIEKPLSLDKILISVANALRLSELKSENEELKRAVTNGNELIGKSTSIRALTAQGDKLANVSLPVMITGESGSGKAQLALYLHGAGARSERPFVVLRCGSMPGELLEAELFGCEKGACAGALTQRKGKVDIADGGTLFLDEISELPLTAQSRLLQLIQDGAYERPGGTRQVRVSVRLVAATTRDLAERIRDGRFREDLYYRMTAATMHMPSLMEHSEDIPLLVNHFMSLLNKKEGMEPKLILPETMDLLMQYDWPGNVRELRNIVERVMIMAPSHSITPMDLPDLGIRTASEMPSLSGETLRGAREEFEREFIVKKLEEHDWNISRTAEAIELERSNLHRKIKSYGIDVKK